MLRRRQPPILYDRVKSAAPYLPRGIPPGFRRAKAEGLIAGFGQGEEGFYELTVMVDSLFNQIWERQRRYQKAFIREHAGDFSTLLVVNYHFGVRPVLSPKTDAEDYMRVDSGLMSNYPGNLHTIFFHKWLREVK